MRMLCMFDLPVETGEEQRAYRQFRKNIMKEGFIMMQYSVYVRTCIKTYRSVLMLGDISVVDDIYIVCGYTDMRK